MLTTIHSCPTCQSDVEREEPEHLTIKTIDGPKTTTLRTFYEFVCGNYGTLERNDFELELDGNCNSKC